MEARLSPAHPLWLAVDRLVDRSPSLEDLREHRLHLLAARRWRELGRPVPADLALEERVVAMTQLAVGPLLERVRGAVDGRVVVFKGPEAAGAYADPRLRPFGDIDILVADPEAAQAALLAAGFREVGDPALYIGIHHLRPLAWPGLPLHLELHAHPKWLPGRTPPSFEALAEAAVPSVSGVDGIVALAPEHHAVVLAVHSWAHEPLRRISDLVDVAAVAWDIDPAASERVAQEFGLPKLWRTVSGTVDAALFGGSSSWHLRTWAPSVAEARRRTVLEAHLEPLLSPFGMAKPLPALAAAGHAALADLRPTRSEPWVRKLRRAAIAVRHAFEPRTGHDRALEDRDLL